MAIFSRRTIQNMINDNSKFLSKEQVSRHIQALNKANDESLSSEWEVVLLYALGKLGKVVYEPNLGGKRRPDLYFIPQNSLNEAIVADIVTVSDRGYEAENPLEKFTSELWRFRKKYGLKQGSFSWKVDGTPEGPFRNKKIKLNLPKKGEFHRIFNENFHQFMKRIKFNPDLKDSFVMRTKDIDISISYNPKEGYDSGSNLVYNVAYSLTKNPIYNDLKRKRDQLKGTNYKGPLAVFLCDGGCHALRSKMYSPDTFRLKDIIYHYLRRTSSVSLIVTLTIKTRVNSFPLRSNLELDIQFFSNSETMENWGNQLIDELVGVIPEPVSDVMNAVNHLKSKHCKEGLSKYGGINMSRKRAEISARALLALLSGRVSQEKFLKDHGLVPSERHKDAVNLFDKILCEGRLIDEIRIEKSISEDDDRIIIEFGDPDPAISKFTIPKN